jgi:hypothetical protein
MWALEFGMAATRRSTDLEVRHRQEQMAKLGMLNIAIFYSNLSVDSRVQSICTGAIRYIRFSLTADATKSIAYAVVGSRLDYANSLLSGISKSSINKLHCVQNTRASVALGSCWEHTHSCEAL